MQGGITQYRVTIEPSGNACLCNALPHLPSRGATDPASFLGDESGRGVGLFCPRNRGVAFEFFPPVPPRLRVPAMSKSMRLPLHQCTCARRLNPRKSRPTLRYGRKRPRKSRLRVVGGCHLFFFLFLPESFYNGRKLFEDIDTPTQLNATPPRYTPHTPPTYGGLIYVSWTRHRIRRTMRRGGIDCRTHGH